MPTTPGCERRYVADRFISAVLTGQPDAAPEFLAESRPFHRSGESGGLCAPAVDTLPHHKCPEVKGQAWVHYAVRCLLHPWTKHIRCRSVYGDALDRLELFFSGGDAPSHLSSLILPPGQRRLATYLCWRCTCRLVTVSRCSNNYGLIISEKLIP